MYRKAAELFGRLTSKVVCRCQIVFYASSIMAMFLQTTNNPTLWQLYSQLHKDHYERVDGSAETLDKVR